METTDNLALPYIMPSQAQKHVTHNEALRLLDALVQPAVAGIHEAPPDDAMAGDRVIVGPEGTGVFASRAGQIAQWSDGGWLFHVPRAGWTAYDLEAERLLVFDGASWETVAGESGGEVPLLGVATPANDDNRLAVASANVLFSHAGTDQRLKINKAETSDTASLVFQTGFEGRAEMGLAGNDDFSVKVSADGEAWLEAMRIDAASGRVRFPGGGVREQLDAARTYHVATSGNDAADGLSEETAFATLQRAMDAALALDPLGHQVTVKLADGTYSSGGRMTAALFDGGILIIRGNTTTPASVTIAAGSGDALVFDGAGVRVQLEGLRVSGGVGVWARYGAVVLLRSRNAFGACTARHVGADNSGYVEIIGEIAISGSSPTHLLAAQGGHILMAGSTVSLSGTPAFGSGFARAQQLGIVSAYANSYSGSATGSRYSVTQNGVIFVNGGGANVFPGSAAGSVATGGQYG
jgi:hypothetical protein